MTLDLDNEVNHYLAAAGVDVERSAVSGQRSDKARELEEKGWRAWLMTLCPFAFEEEFSADHELFWTLWWSVLFRIREQKKYILLGVPIPEKFEIKHEELVILFLLGRGLAKSSTLEAAAMMKGCLIGAGYALTVCEAQDQAEEHIGNIKWLIDADDSRVTEFYPHMAIDDNVMFDGKKTKNRTDLFITVGGWICRAKGLNAKLRGIRIGKWRPDLINIDDIDSVNDSIAVSIKKLKQLLTSVFPTLARKHAQVNVGQNIILETGVVNQIHTGQSDALADRTTIGVTNTFEKFRENIEYVTYLDDTDGRIHHKILPAAIATWKGVDRAEAQRFLSISGLDAFLAEYMNSFAHQKTGKVFSEWDERRHVITWEDFERVYGVRHVPGNWKAKAAADLGYTRESVNAWLWVARAAKNAKGPAGLYFGYRSRTYDFDSVDDQATAIWEEMFPDAETGKKHFEARQRFVDYPELFRILQTRPRCAPYMKHFAQDPITERFTLNPFDPVTGKDASGQVISDEDKAMFYVNRAKKEFQSQIVSWVISHEKTGEQKTLAQKYGIPAVKVARFESDAGVTEANHLLRGDYTQPHPFYPDEIVKETGLYKLGRPYIYFLVRRVQSPEDDRDMRLFRQQVSQQPWTQQKLTDLGLTRSVPFKKDSDHADCLRHFCVDYALPDSTPLTLAEEIEQRVPEKHRKPDRPETVEEQMSRQFAEQYAKERVMDELGVEDEDFDESDEYDEEDYG